jgi:signal transduction histidine kinase
VIEQVTADGRDVPPSRSVSLRPDNAKLEVHYGVVLLRSQERVRFRYMLQGFDRDWSEPTLGRVAYYTNLPPGRYQFRVAAFEMNNPEQITESSLEIDQRPHFYRTAWFLGCCVLLLAGIVFAAYQFRLGQLRARFHGVLEERSRLAREIHDTLIQGCTSVSAVLEAYSTFGNSDVESKQELLDCARVQLRSTIAEVREAVWDMRHSNEPAPAIAPLLQKMAEQVSHEFKVPVECQILGKPFDIAQSTGHELLMVAREALYNAVRHAQPSKVALIANFELEKFALRIHDDGSGFDPQSEAALSEEHYGLIGMQERVKHVGGTFQLKSRPGAGTDLAIEVPRKLMTRSTDGPDLTL